MGRFIVRGLDPKGRRRTERVAAADAAEAFTSLCAAGWSELELLSDAIFATGGSTPAMEASRPRVEAFFDPDEELSFSRHGAWWQVWMAIKKGGWVLVALFACLLWRRVTGQLMHGWDLALWLTFLAMVGVGIYMFRSSSRYRRLVEASAAARRDEVLRRTDSLQRSSLGKLIPPAELAFRRAGALIGLGRCDEGLALFTGADHGSNPEWLVAAQLGDLQSRCHRLDQALASYRRAAELGGVHAEAHLSLAEFLAGHNVRDAAGARAALAQARTLPIAASVQWAVERIEAMIAIEENRHVEALVHLQRSRADLLRLADSGLHRLHMAFYAAYAAIALGALGRRAEAQRVLTDARAATWLPPHAPELLARAQDAADC